MIDIYCDGGSRGNPGLAAAGFVVYQNKKQIHEGSSFLGRATNNVAEYKAVLLAINWLSKSDLRNNEKITCYLDSELVTRQLRGEYKIKNTNLAALALQIKDLENKLPTDVVYKEIKREDNAVADSLVNKELDRRVSRS